MHYIFSGKPLEYNFLKTCMVIKKQHFAVSLHEAAQVAPTSTVSKYFEFGDDNSCILAFCCPFKDSRSTLSILEGWIHWAGTNRLVATLLVGLCVSHTGVLPVISGQTAAVSFCNHASSRYAYIWREPFCIPLQGNNNRCLPQLNLSRQDKNTGVTQLPLATTTHRPQ